MIPVQKKKNIGPAGLAEVKVQPAKLVVIFAESKDVYDLSKEDWPENCPSGLYNVTLSFTRDKVLFVSPPTRAQPYAVTFWEFGNRGRDTNIPQSKLDPARTGVRRSDGQPFRIPARDVFTAKLKVVEDGPYQGLVIPYKLPMIFARYEGTNTTMLNGSDKQNGLVEEFLTVAGGMNLMNEEIPWSENVLVWLESRMQYETPVFQVTLDENGFIKTLIPLPQAFLPPMGANGKDKKTPKKAATKAAKKSAKAAKK